MVFGGQESSGWMRANVRGFECTVKLGCVIARYNQCIIVHFIILMNEDLPLSFDDG